MMRASGLRNCATSSIGFTVAESPMRCGFGPSTSASRRASDSARCEPRLSSATAWISSTITVRVVRSMRREPSAVSRMYSDSGVVTRMCGGCLPICWRSHMGVSPVRTAVRIGASRMPFSAASAAISASGISRFLWMSLLSALSGET